jgi:hypothetical protein
MLRIRGLNNGYKSLSNTSHIFCGKISWRLNNSHSTFKVSWRIQHPKTTQNLKWCIISFHRFLLKTAKASMVLTVSSQAIAAAAAALGEGPGGFRHIGGTKAMAAATTGSSQLRPKPDG